VHGTGEIARRDGVAFHATRLGERGTRAAAMKEIQASKPVTKMRASSPMLKPSPQPLKCHEFSLATHERVGGEVTLGLAARAWRV
jgi:hypothetical protein